MTDWLKQLFLESTAPIDAKDLPPESTILIPNGAAFGTPQLFERGVAIDWVRGGPDAYWVEGDRGSAHSGVDIAFFTMPWGRQTAIVPLPAGVPVRAPLDAIVEEAGVGADPEPGPGAVVFTPSRKDPVRPYVHLTDFHVSVKAGTRVRRGEQIGVTALYSRAHPVVVLHFGVGLLVDGEAPNPLDPTALVRRFGWRHPVRPGAACDARVLRAGSVPGVWTERGRIQDLLPCGRFDRRWKDSFR